MTDEWKTTSVRIERVRENTVPEGKYGYCDSDPDDVRALLEEYDRLALSADRIGRTISILEKARDGEQAYLRARVISALECLRGQS